MASVNKQKIFYDNIKIEIEAGQYYIEDMLVKLTKATAKNLLTVDMYEELEVLAKEKVDTTYEKTVTVEDLKDKIVDLELEVQDLSASISDLTDIMFELYDVTLSTDTDEDLEETETTKTE